jgi:hypothetical protein
MLSVFLENNSNNSDKRELPDNISKLIPTCRKPSLFGHYVNRGDFKDMFPHLHHSNLSNLSNKDKRHNVSDNLTSDTLTPEENKQKRARYYATNKDKICDELFKNITENTEINPTLKTALSCYGTYIFYRAAMTGKLEILQWLKSRGCKWNEWTYIGAIEQGHVHIVKWLLKNKCPGNAWVCCSAAQHGRFKILKLLRKHGCPWDKDTCTEAFLHSHYDILCWALTNGCNYDVTMLNKLVIPDILKLQSYDYALVISKFCSDCDNSAKLDLFIKQSEEKHLNLFLGDLVCKDIIQLILEKY